MIDDVSYIETYIKRRLPDVTVFQNSTDGSEAEIDVQNLPGRDLNLVRLLLSRQNAATLRQDADVAERLIATLERALNEPSREPEAILDLRSELS